MACSRLAVALGLTPLQRLVANQTMVNTVAGILLMIITAALIAGARSAGQKFRERKKGKDHK